MLQLSFFELDEINTYGFFNINLNIVMSVSIIKNVFIIEICRIYSKLTIV